MSQTDNRTVKQLKTLVRTLVDLSDGIDATDLGALAQIHENALNIERWDAESPATKSEPLARLAQGIYGLAESVILENCSDPKDALTNLTRAVQELDQAIQVLDGLPDPEVLCHCLSLLQIESGQNPAPSKTESGAGEPPPSNEAESKPSGPVDPAVASQTSEDAQPASETEISPSTQEYVQEPLVLAESEFEYVKSFLTECQEHIDNIEGGLLTLEQTPDDLDKINELFRPFHTIKGMAGFLNLRDVQSLTHHVETLLDLGRKGKLKVTSGTIDLVFEALDVLKVQVNAIGQYCADPNGKPIPQPLIADLLVRLDMASKGKYVSGVVAPDGRTAERKPIGEILAEDKGLAPEVVEFALNQQDQKSQPVGTILTQMGAVDARDVSKALRKQKTELQETVVRVDTAKLDNLVNLVGELVIVQTQVEQNRSGRLDPKLVRLVEQVSKITRDLQEIAMSMRMVPISQTFQKMGRVLRDLARKVDKKISYELEGEETELDKNVIQELSDPLMHMIRNAVDHGIEMPADRVKAGKPEQGTVTLKAYHQGGNIVIEIVDDGKGLDKDVLIRKGIEKGLISPDAQLTEAQAFGLIMAPGFSTAEKVTDISGRGVGMDVVKKNIEKLRGKVEIKSKKGQGTVFTIRLPLTLAVIDGMVIRVGTQKFILPTLSIVQSLSPTTEQVQTIQNRGRVLNLRGNIYPLIALGDMFNLAGAGKDITKTMVVIAQAENQQVGLILDELLGQQQVVIKSLGDRFKGIRGVAGGAILGDGTVGLILEPAGLLELYQHTPASIA